MNRFSSLAVCASLLCTPIPLFSGTFGPPDGEKRIIPPIEVFGEKAKAYDFQHRSKEDEEMEEAGEFDPKSGKKNFESNIRLKGKDVLHHRGEFLFTVLDDNRIGIEILERTQKSYTDLNKDGWKISEMNEEGICRYFFEERGKQATVRGLVKNLSFIYVSIGTDNPLEMVEEFRKNYVAFLEGKITVQEPVIPERNWTSNGGKEMKGSVLSYDSEKNTISFRRFDGKVYPAMSLDLLSAEDQKAIREKLGEP